MADGLTDLPVAVEMLAAATASGLDLASVLSGDDEHLRPTDIAQPALLLEAGSIVNRQEELELATPERRTLTGEAVAAAVEDFCAARAHPKIERLVKRPANRRAASPVAR